MPRKLRDYGLSDWLHLRPVTQGWKTHRYRLADRAFRNSPARSPGLEAVKSSLRGRRVLVSVAFNDPTSVSRQVALIRHYVPAVVHVVADNSTDDEAAREISDRTVAKSAFYVRLPANPTRSPSRSHGLALNWVWHNVIRGGCPKYFGFLDDDIFPTAPSDPFEALSQQAFYGVIRPGIPQPFDEKNRWFLWAGFSMFNFDLLGAIDLDFSQDWFVGLDTGGGNWERLYQYVDRASILEQETRFEPFRAGLDVSDGPVQWCGSWLHSVGLMGNPDLMKEKAQAITDILAPHLLKVGHPL